MAAHQAIGRVQRLFATPTPFATSTHRGESIIPSAKRATRRRTPPAQRTAPVRPETLDLDALQSIEVRGNQVILTSKEDIASSSSDADAIDPVEASLEAATSLLDSVVKVYCVHTEPNYSLPWQRKRQYSSTSSGFIVAGPDGTRWLLTNAHSVEYHSQVKVKRRGTDRKFIAKVLAVGTECDIALLTVEDNEFWEGVVPISLGPLPRLQDSVYVVGYPIGGDTISVTSGVVSRIEVTAYAHGATELLGIQIDAAINSGNSGGPVFEDAGHCVGIAFQSYSGSDVENIGWIIPTPVILHFLDDFQRNGAFTAFPALGIQWQRMESEALRASYGMTAGQKGVLVRLVQPISHASGVLRSGDILQRFDGVEVACDGTVPFLSGERIAFSYLTSQKFTGDTCSLDILRDGKPLSVSVQLMRPNSLVPHHLAGGDPSYLVVAGVVFTVASEPYLQSEYGADYMREAPVKLLERLLYGHKRSADEQVVIVSQVLACEATVGYEDLHNMQVKAFNGEPVLSLRHLAHMVLECEDEFMRFDVGYEEVLVLNAEQAVAATEEVLRAHSIPGVVSKDLIDLLVDDDDDKEEVEEKAGSSRVRSGDDAGDSSGVDEATVKVEEVVAASTE